MNMRRVNETLFFYKYSYREIIKKMQSLSHKEYGELRSLYESIYAPKEELTEEVLDEVFNELVDELIEEGYEEEEAIEIVDEAVDSYYDSAVRASKKAAQGIDKAARQKRRAGQVRYAKRKAGEALKGAVSAVKGAADRAVGTAKAAKAGVEIAGSIAKDEARRAGRKAAQAVTSAPGKAKAAVDRKKEETKKGIKGFIKRQAQKVVNRMSEELEATGLFSEKEIEAIMGAEMSEAMSSYDRNRKRAAERAAARNAARDAGKTGVVPGVGYVSPRREKETYTDEQGTVRHKSGAKMEEVEAVDEGKSSRPRYPGGRGVLDTERRQDKRDAAAENLRGHTFGPATTTKNPKKLRKQKAMGELPVEENFELWVYGLVEEGYDLSDYTWMRCMSFILMKQKNHSHMKRSKQSR